MMVIVRKKFKLDGLWWESVGKANSAHSVHELSEVFDIPKGVEEIWLSLHDRSGVNRAVGKVELYKNFGLNYPQFVSNELPQKIEWTNETMDKILNKFVGKTLHLQCEYEA